MPVRVLIAEPISEASTFYEIILVNNHFFCCRPMENTFRTMNRNRMCQDVVEQVQAAILNGRFLPGEKLPAEKELCDMFRTSGDLVREALEILEQKSLVEPGGDGGVYVREANSELMAENLAMLIRSHTVSLQHLAEFREGVEGNVAALAARRSMAADNKILAKLIDEAAGFCEEGLAGWNSFVQVDEKIHMEIARIAGNPLYNFVLHSIHDNIHRYYDKFLNIGMVEMEENFQDLQLIIQSVAAGDAEEARHLAVEHVRRFSRYMEQKKRQNPEL